MQLFCGIKLSNYVETVYENTLLAMFHKEGLPKRVFVIYWGISPRLESKTAAASNMPVNQSL